MQDLKNTKAPVSTVTLNRNEFDEKPKIYMKLFP